jgi:hypothetical protein
MIINVLRILLVALILRPFILKAEDDSVKNAKKSLFSRKDTTALNNTINYNYQIKAKRLTGVIKLDGVIDEADWLNAEKASNFYMVLPYDTGHSAARSEVMMAYDEKAFYIAFIFYDTIPGKRPVESLRRDFTFSNNDNFLVFLDPYNDQTTGYSFGVNAAGALWDGTMSNGYASNLIWDIKWDAKVKNYKDRWVSEMRIPFKSVRYKNNVDHWNVQFSRLDLKLNEKSAWAPVPRQFPTASLAYAGQLNWETPPPPSGIKLSLIPYLYGGASRNFINNEEVKYHKDFGFDAKVGLSSSMNLDLTYNPDFSQAEVDDQVTNLERFELYFPEKRQFFLENSDLFANYGTDNIRPFFSRRIGLDAPVDAGARLSGKIGKDWRIGVMDMQTESDSDNLARNFMVASLQRKVFSRSNIGMIFVNKQQMDIPSDWIGNSYNRVAGMEYNLASRDNFWTGKLFGQKSFSPGTDAAEEFSQGFNIAYARKSYLLEFKEFYVGKDFNAETGYVPRVDYLRVNPRATIKFYPKKGALENHGFFVETDNFYRPEDMQLTDREISADYDFLFKSRALLQFKSNFMYVLLRKDFDPTNQGEYFLPEGSDYDWVDGSVKYTSDNRKLFKYVISAGYGGYFNGKRWFTEGTLNYRFQPYGYISLIYSYNDLDLPQPWEQTGFWLVGPKLDLTLTNKIFFTTYVQYNEQADNLNVNARFQWRYKPVSDLFLVYTDNYFPGSMNVKNRALVMKLSYWFN